MNLMFIYCRYKEISPGKRRQCPMIGHSRDGCRAAFVSDRYVLYIVPHHPVVLDGGEVCSVSWNRRAGSECGSEQSSLKQAKAVITGTCYYSNIFYNNYFLFKNMSKRFEVLEAASMKMAVFWVVAPCSRVEVYRRFREACCLHHQSYLIMEASTSETSVNIIRRHGATTEKTAIFMSKQSSAICQFSEHAENGK
jgi:hypothetical protein